MKLKNYLLGTAFVITGLLSNAHTQNKNEEKPTILHVTQARIKRVENNMVVVSYRDSICQRKCKLYVKIFDGEHELIYCKYYRKEGDVNLIYDISKFPEGKYTFKLYEKRAVVYSKIISKQTNAQTKIDIVNLALN